MLLRSDAREYDWLDVALWRLFRCRTCASQSIFDFLGLRFEHDAVVLDDSIAQKLYDHNDDLQAALPDC